MLLVGCWFKFFLTSKTWSEDSTHTHICYPGAQHRYICSNSQQYIVWVKIIHFYFMPKIIRILRSCSMKIFPTVNISKFHFWLVICRDALILNFSADYTEWYRPIPIVMCKLKFGVVAFLPVHGLLCSMYKASAAEPPHSAAGDVWSHEESERGAFN